MRCIVVPAAQAHHGLVPRWGKQSLSRTRRRRVRRRVRGSRRRAGEVSRLPLRGRDALSLPPASNGPAPALLGQNGGDGRGVSRRGAEYAHSRSLATIVPRRHRSETRALHARPGCRSRTAWGAAPRRLGAARAPLGAQDGRRTRNDVSARTDLPNCLRDCADFSEHSRVHLPQPLGGTPELEFARTLVCV